MWVPCEVAERKQYKIVDMSSWKNVDLNDQEPMLAWCEDNICGNWSYCYVKVKPRFLSHPNDLHRIVKYGPWFYFEKRNDILLFKLKWA